MLVHGYFGHITWQMGFELTIMESRCISSKHLKEQLLGNIVQNKIFHANDQKLGPTMKMQQGRLDHYQQTQWEEEVGEDVWIPTVRLNLPAARISSIRSANQDSK